MPPPTIAHYNGTRQRPPSTPPALVVTLPPNRSELQWHPAMAPRPLPQKLVVTPPQRPPPNHSTLQWHPAMAHSKLQWHPAKLLWHLTLPPNHSTLQWILQWHHVHSSKVGRHPRPHHSTKMAPCNGTTSTPPKLAVTLAPTVAHYNGTLQWHPAMAPVGRHPPPTTIAHYNGTLRWHGNGTASSDPAMAPWCHVQSAKVVRRLPPYWK